MDKIIISETNKILNVNWFSDTIFKNFIYLSKVKELQHTKQDIVKLLLSKQLLCYLIYHNIYNKLMEKYNKVLIGYLIGDFRTLNDGRSVYYISYLFISGIYRNKKIGTLVMKLLFKKCKYLGIKFILLTCDSSNKKIVDFYKKMGFIKDPLLGNSSLKYNVYCLFMD